MATYKNMKEAMAGVQKAIDKVLTKDVAPLVEEILSEHIKSDIYDAYTPIENGWVGNQTYSRRHALEGAIFSKMVDKYTLSTTSSAAPGKPIVKGKRAYGGKKGQFFDLIESNNHGIWDRSGHGFPRYPVRNAQAEVDANTHIVDVIIDGIQKEL